VSLFLSFIDMYKNGRRTQPEVLGSNYFQSPKICRSGSSFCLVVKKGSPRNISMGGKALHRRWECWTKRFCCAPKAKEESGMR